MCFAQLLHEVHLSNLKKLYFINPWFCTWFGGTGFIKKPPNDRLLLQTLISLIFCLHPNRGNTLIRRLREVRSKWLRFYNEFFFFLRSSEFVELWMVICYQNCSDLLWEKCSSDQVKPLKFEAECRELAKILGSLEQFIQAVKGQNNFW